MSYYFIVYDNRLIDPINSGKQIKYKKIKSTFFCPYDMKI